MQIDQDMLILIRELLPSANEPPLLTYFLLGLVLGTIIVIIKHARYKKIKELFMKLF